LPSFGSDKTVVTETWMAERAWILGDIARGHCQTDDLVRLVISYPERMVKGGH